MILIFVVAVLAACTDDESFTTSRSERLTFSADTVRLDTLFSTVPSSTYTFWVYNHSTDGLRLKQIRLDRGNQSGYRVNVDGTFLGQTTGYQVNDLEVRKGDSLRVFVELTSVENHAEDPLLVEDNLIFTLESGVEQRVNLSCYSWDAIKLTNPVISRDTVIESTKPIVVYGMMRVDSAATLTIHNTSLYFHANAGIDVYGQLQTGGERVLLRGDRLDHMFDYLPYDRVSGQWRGIHIYPSSSKNVLERTEIRNAEYGILCDSAAVDSTTLRLLMRECVVHNAKGPGIQAFNTLLGLYKCQISNTLGDCVAVYGGGAQLLNCTLAQFYPFSANRGVALRFANYYEGYSYPLAYLVCQRSLITGYEDDVILGESRDSTVAYAYYFEDCLMRTPIPEDTTVLFRNIIWETPKDSINGKKHFIRIDEDNLSYDFHLDSISPVYGKGVGCY
ncbi:MAG: right-handed parallel beta-helix repeat-containing protein [Prevotella sp.]|nr:right-handed parallel beta-helix repeat-containing protein [Prevotella sp.]